MINKYRHVFLLNTLQIISILFFVGNCSTAPVISFEHLTRPDDKEEETHITLNYKKQITGYSCGIASLTMVLNYWDVPVTQEELLKKYPPVSIKKGYTIGELKMITKETGLQAFSIDSDMDFIKKQISLGRPVICVLEMSQDNGVITVLNRIPIINNIAIFLWEKIVPKEVHFIVVAGFSNNTFLVADPISGISRINFDRFQAFWRQGKNALLLVGR